MQQSTVSTSTDPRPAAAVGHVFLMARDANAAAERLRRVGVRVLVSGPGMAILELRGGTHIVVREDTRLSDAYRAEFDLMFDRADDAAAVFQQAGFEVGPIRRGSIHDTFRASAPEGFSLSVTSSHAGDRPV